MQVIVHGGMQKTGSSALQEYLAAHRSGLRDIGIIYPDFGHRGHWLLSAAFTKKPGSYHHSERRLADSDIQAEVDAALRKLKDIILSAGPDEVVILSHEDLSVVSKAQKLREFVTDSVGRESAFIMLAYIRNPVEHFPSAVQQALKAGKDRSFAPSDWISPHLARAPQLRATLGDEVVYRAHSPIALKDGDVIEDFRQFILDRTGKVMPARTASIEVNASISARACAIIQASELLGTGEQASKVLRRAVRQFDATQPKVKLVPPAEWNAHIAHANGPAWNSVVTSMDYTAEIKEILRIQDVVVTGRHSDAEVCDWVLSYLDTDYTAAFLLYHQENNRGKPVAKLVETVIKRIRIGEASSKLKDWEAAKGRKLSDRHGRTRKSG